MISKGYHYVINLGIAFNFFISIDPVYSRSCPRRSIVAGELRDFSLLHRFSNPLSMMSFDRA